MTLSIVHVLKFHQNSESEISLLGKGNKEKPAETYSLLYAKPFVLQLNRSWATKRAGRKKEREIWGSTLAPDQNIVSFHVPDK